MHTPHPVDVEMAVFVGEVVERPHLYTPVVLSELVTTGVGFLPGAQHAGVTVAHRGQVVTEASSGPVPHQLDSIQRECGVGPCLSAATDGAIIYLGDLETDSRWPEFSRAAVTHTPVRSMLSVAVPYEGQGHSALNLYAENPHAFGTETIHRALTYATYTSLAWRLARRDEQFRKALASRDTIGQAKGLIMERFTIDAEQAFDLLKRLSQSSNVPLARIAAEIVAAESNQRAKTTRRCA